MKRKKIILFIGVALVITAVAGWLLVTNPFANKANKTGDQQSNKSGGKQICPEAWYDNQMPGPPGENGSQYFIVNGERVELSELDVDWVKANCSVNKPEVVQ